MQSSRTFVRSLPGELLNDFKESALACEKIAHLNLLCLRFALRIGADAIAYHHLPSIGSGEPIGLNIICVGFPADLVSHFKDNRVVQIDPTIQETLSGGKARWWDEPAPPRRRMSKAEREYLEYAASKVGTGLHFPTYGPNGRQGYVSIGFGPKKPDFSEAEMANIQLYGQVAHQRYCQLLQEPVNPNVSLSPREREVLSWVAEGKSNGVIADILQVSETSVITYLERAFRKLDVDNRVTAALRASSLGELRHR